MAKLSPVRESWPLLKGLTLLNRGKVRDTYDLGNGILLALATDGVSVFDFVLQALVPMKGIVLTAMNVFWLRHLKSCGIKTHLVAAGADIDKYLPPGLRGNIDLQSRAIVVKKLKILPIEFVGRDVLTGSALRDYLKTGIVCGERLPVGLQDGDELPCIWDTPTSKEDEGHDKALSAQVIRSNYSAATLLMLRVYQIVARLAEKKGIKLADTKFEFGIDEEGNIIVADEVCTPDSSRFILLSEWLESRKPAEGRKMPATYDKQFVRNWGIKVGISKLDHPDDPAEIAQVHAMAVPKEIISQTTAIYRYIFWLLTGDTIEEYLSDEMKVRVLARPPKRVAVICGSDSDKADVKAMLLHIGPGEARINLHIMSCHRNAEETAEFARKCSREADVIICAGSKAFHLPGDIDAFAHAAGKDIPVIGVALGKPGSRALLAAQLSIEEIPGQLVIMSETSGVYTGQGGLVNAMTRIIHGELPPAKARTEKPVQMNVWSNTVDCA